MYADATRSLCLQIQLQWMYYAARIGTNINVLRMLKMDENSQRIKFRHRNVRISLMYFEMFNYTFGILHPYFQINCMLFSSLRPTLTNGKGQGFRILIQPIQLFVS